MRGSGSLLWNVGGDLQWFSNTLSKSLYELPVKWVDWRPVSRSWRKQQRLARRFRASDLSRAWSDKGKGNAILEMGLGDEALIDDDNNKENFSKEKKRKIHQCGNWVEACERKMTFLSVVLMRLLIQNPASQELLRGYNPLVCVQSLCEVSFWVTNISTC